VTPEESFSAHWVKCAQHAKVLGESLADAVPWLPLLEGQSLGKEPLRIFDQMAYRFAKLQDSMGEKLLPAILGLAQEPIAPSATFAEKLNRLERIGVIPSAEEWKQLRSARNAIAHEYPDDPALQASAINEFYSAAKRLSALFASIAQYVSAHFAVQGAN